MCVCARVDVCVYVLPEEAMRGSPHLEWGDDEVTGGYEPLSMNAGDQTQVFPKNVLFS